MFLLSFMGLNVPLVAQEFLTGLKTNPQILKNIQQQHVNYFKGNLTSENTPVLLPFFEDFSNYTGYPNEKLFIDRQAFVNNTFPVFAPTIGVVTLDAINEYGEIYPHLTTVSQGADTLTSRYIRLDSLFFEGIVRKITPADSIYFSFFFQPGGGGLVSAGTEENVGNQPEVNDSLVLEFGYLLVLEDTAYTVWDHIWSTPGFNIREWTSVNPHEYFRQILIPITAEKYLCNNFQFRFRNYASLEPQPGMIGWEGNVDQWHIDYIRLDVNRHQNDRFTNDLAFVSPTTSFLKNYQAMPWNQFQPADMKTNFTNQLTNLNSEENGTRTATYRYTITKNGYPVYEHPITGAIDIRPYVTNGVHTNPYQALPDISFTPPVLTDTTTFVITHVFQNATGAVHDFWVANDTCVFEQKFYNYYAYDDGTAEYGYCLNNQHNIAYFAMKFSLRRPDSLSAIRIWFNQTKNSENKDARFTIVVWEDKDGQPGKELYAFEDNQPQFAEQFWDFVEYAFDKKIQVFGTFWVGFKQHGNVQLNIGFDQNTDSRAFFRFNTRGIWEQSVFKGTPMLRPVFGELDLSICCLPPQATTTIRPNPANDWVEIMNYKLQISKVEIYDVMGRKMKGEGRKEKGEGVWWLNISHLSAGIYFIKIHKENNTFETIKLIKN